MKKKWTLGKRFYLFFPLAPFLYSKIANNEKKKKRMHF